MRELSGLLVEQETGWALVQLGSSPRLLWQGTLPELLSAWPQVSRGVATKGALKPLAQVVVASRSENFLFSNFPFSEVGGGRGRATLKFRLEADLPLSAEEIVCDFQFSATSAEQPSVSAVACERAVWVELARMLEENNCQLKALTPYSLLVVQSLDALKKFADANCLILLKLDGPFEIILLSQGQVVLWRLTGDLNNTLRDWRVLQQAWPTAKLYCVGSDTQPDVPLDVSGEHVQRLHIDASTAVSDFASKVLAGQNEPWFDVSTERQLAGDSANRETHARFRRWAVALTGCCLIVALACYGRAVRVRSTLAKLKQQQIALYEAVFPGQTVPSALMARLKSEYSKLTGSRGSTKNLESVNPSLPALEQVVSNLPTDLEMSVYELRIQSSEIYLDVELAQFEDAGRVAQALQASGLNLDPPTTSAAKDGRVRAQIRGRRNSMSPEGRGKS